MCPTNAKCRTPDGQSVGDRHRQTGRGRRPRVTRLSEIVCAPLRGSAIRLLATVVAFTWLPCPAAMADEPAGEADEQVRAALAEQVRPIAARLIDLDLKVRQEAARELGRLGPASASAVADLLTAMREPAMQPPVSEALARIGPAALPRLVAALDDADPFYRVAALRAIWEITDPGRSGSAGRDDGRPVRVPDQPALFGKLAVQLGKDRPDQLRLASAEVIARLVARPDAELGPSASMVVKALVESLAEPAKGTQAADARALAAIGRPALPALLTALNDKRMPARMGAAEALGLMGPRTGQPAPVAANELERAVPILIAWLDHEQWRLRLAAAQALGAMGPAAKPAVPKLVQIAWFTNRPKVEAGDDPESAGPFWAWQAAERALIRLGPVSAAAAPVLVEVLKDRGSERRVAAVETLAAIGPASAPAAPKLLELVRDPTWPLPALAIEALANTGPAAVGAAVELLKDPDEQLAASGAEVVRRIGPQSAVATEALVARLNGPASGPLRGVCLDALVALGPGAVGAIDAVARMIPAEKEGDLRHKMFTLLASAGTAGVGPLVGLLESKDAELRREAVGALGWAGGLAARAVPALVGRLGDSDLTVRMLAAVALGKAGEAAVGPLLEATRSGDAEVRSGACEALGRAGRAASAHATDRLLALLADRSAPVRSSAAWALGRMGRATLAEPAVRSALLARLHDAEESSAVRSAAIESLGEAPGATADLVRTLAGMRTDPKLADAATAALARVGAAVHER